MQFPKRNADPTCDAWARDVEDNLNGLDSEVTQLASSANTLKHAADLNYTSAVRQLQNFNSYLSGYQRVVPVTKQPTYDNLAEAENYFERYLEVPIKIGTFSYLSAFAAVNYNYGLIPSVSGVFFNASFSLRAQYCGVNADNVPNYFGPYFYLGQISNTNSGISTASGYGLYSYNYINYYNSDGIIVDVAAVEEYVSTRPLLTHVVFVLAYTGDMSTRYTSAQSIVTGTAGITYTIQDKR